MFYFLFITPFPLYFVFYFGVKYEVELEILLPEVIHNTMRMKSNHEERWWSYCRVCKNSYESPTIYAITISHVVGSGWESGCEDPLVEVFGRYNLVLNWLTISVMIQQASETCTKRLCSMKGDFNIFFVGIKWYILRY